MLGREEKSSAVQLMCRDSAVVFEEEKQIEQPKQLPDHRENVLLLSPRTRDSSCAGQGRWS